MDKPRILKPGESYTFSKYFELPYAPEDILADLGCAFERSYLSMPSYSGSIQCLPFLEQYIRRNLQHVNPVSETARRDVLIAPTLLEVCHETNSQLNIEYPIAVTEQLKGTLDYFIPALQNLLVIEAKQADLGRGFTQLAVELIAIDQWTTSQSPMLYGAVTTGDDWRFGVYERQRQLVVQDISLYRVPEGLEELLRTLIGILRGCTPTAAETQAYALN
jgi:hypothetical protein